MQATRTADTSPLGVVVVDACAPGRPILHVSEQLAFLMQDGSATLVGRPAAELPELIGGVAELTRLWRALEQGAPAVATWRTVTPRGEIRWLEVHAAPMPGRAPGAPQAGQPQDGRAAARDVWVFHLADVTGREADRALVADSEQRLRSLLEELPAVVYSDDVSDEDDITRRVYVSAPILDLTGYSAAEMRADPALWPSLVLPDDLDRLPVRRSVAREGGRVRREYRIRHREGRVIWIRDEAHLVETGTSMLMQGVISDISREREIEQALTHQASHDALTGLPNRVRLRRALEVALVACNAVGRSAALLFMDLDAFKEVNDTLGHEAGDRLLGKVAQRLSGVVRGTDTVARLGGDEFAIVLGMTDGEEGARTVARHVMSTLEPPFLLDGRQVTIGASIGIALSEPGSSDPATLMRHADLAMYQAKRARMGYLVYVPEMDTGISTAGFSRLGELRAAIDLPQLILHYQPWLDLRTGEVGVAEALVRWLHPRDGLLFPGEFLPLAEQSGLIRQLDLAVLDMACEQVRAWLDGGLEAIRVAINVSRASLLDEEFPAALAVALIRHRLEGPEIELEITENGVLGDPDQAAWLAERLTSLGVRLAIDDFGTGYSSLAQLRRLRASTLKIDRGFVTNALRQRDDATIVELVIDLGHRFGQEVVAEGVEDAETLELVRRLGADYAQGFHIARPLAPASLETWLTNRRTEVAA